MFHCVHLLICFIPRSRMRSAQISFLAPKLVIFSNFHRGGPGIFSALNRIFIEEKKEKNQQLRRDLPNRLFLYLFSVTDLHRRNGA